MFFRSCTTKADMRLNASNLRDFEQRLGRLHLAEESAGLPAGGLQQVVDFPVDVDRGARGRQHDEADQLVAGRQRHDQPGVRHLDQPRRQRQAVVAARRGAVFLEVDDPAAFVEEAAQRAVGILGRRLDAACSSARPAQRNGLDGILQPERAGRALDHVGEPLDRRAGSIPALPVLRGQRAVKRSHSSR